MVCQAFYPALLLLRFCDQKTPAMDKLYYYVRQMDQVIVNSKDLLNSIEYQVNVNDRSNRNIAGKMMKYFLNTEEEQLQLARTIEQENNMNGLDRSRSAQLITGPAEDESDDDDDDESNQLDDDLTSDEEEEPHVGPEKLGDLLIVAWNKRSKKLRSDIAISGWMCSSDPLVMKDCNESHLGEDRKAVTRLLTKWYIHEVKNDNEKMGELINTFWQEFEDFQGKAGPYADRKYIFINHPDLTNGNIHLWHKKETLRWTQIFGRFACRVCSKILGIGSAERSWGDVKHLKSNKRSHLSSKATKMQATIFGASCVELARIKHDEKYFGSGPCKIWRTDDFMGIVDNDNDETGHRNMGPERLFNAWIEDWEIGAIRKKDPVNEARILHKYGGLQWRDPDNNNIILIADDKKLHWSRVTATGGGYAVIAYDEFYKEDDPNNINHKEPWYITMDLIGEISSYYKQNRTPDNVVVVDEPQDSAIEDNDDEE
jgi:hypothetical protein